MNRKKTSAVDVQRAVIAKLHKDRRESVKAYEDLLSRQHADNVELRTNARLKDAP